MSTAMKSIVKPNAAGETIGSMAHLKFIPEGIGMDFYLYEGSQTEPPCRPQNWLISKTKFKVLESQVCKMRLFWVIFKHRATVWFLIAIVLIFVSDWGDEGNPWYTW